MTKTITRTRSRSNLGHNWGVRVAEKIALGAIKSLMNKPNPGNIAVGQSNPANDAITSQRDIARVATKRKRLSRKSKKRIKRKVAFRKKVTKALAQKQSMHTWCAPPFTTTTVTTDAVAWNSVPYQTVVGANGLPAANWARFVLGEQNYDGQGNALTTGFSQTMRNFFSKLQTRWNTTDVAPPDANNFSAGVMITHEELNLSMTNMLTEPFNVDVYECVAARDITANDAYGNPQLTWSRCLDTETTAFSAGTTNSINITTKTLGCTPYDAPNFGKHWKILTKTRVYLSPGQATAMQFTNKPHFWREDKAQQLSARKGITKHIFFVLASEIGFDLPALGVDMLRYCISKQVHFKFPQNVANLTNGVVAVMGQYL